jgi:hypothetical protein
MSQNVLPSYVRDFTHLRLRRNDNRSPWQMVPFHSVQAENTFLRIGVFQLAEIPPEVRVKIYREYFIQLSKDITKYQRQDPYLLAAVRGHPLLYREVLESYYGNYNFRLWNHNELNFHNNVSMNLVRSMRHLTLEYADDKDSSPAGSQHIREHIFASSVDLNENLPNFGQFIKKVWYEPGNAKIHQAMNLRTLSVSVQIGGWSSLSDVIDLVDLVFLYFPTLEKFTVYTLYTFPMTRHMPLILTTFDLPPNKLDLLKKEFLKKKNVISMEAYNQGTLLCITGLGFECHWLGEDGKKKCFIMEMRLWKCWPELPNLEGGRGPRVQCSRGGSASDCPLCSMIHTA